MKIMSSQKFVGNLYSQSYMRILVLEQYSNEVKVKKWSPKGLSTKGIEVFKIPLTHLNHLNFICKINP